MLQKKTYRFPIMRYTILSVTACWNFFKTIIKAVLSILLFEPLNYKTRTIFVPKQNIMNVVTVAIRETDSKRPKRSGISGNRPLLPEGGNKKCIK